ncbi:MAG: response regulator [Rhizobiaceae bacterium]|nr:response regulator [Rhizobiaceae bacterium]
MTVQYDHGQPILLIDDNDDDVEATLRAFKRTNFKNTVMRAATGAEGLAMLRERRVMPGLILLDLNMPGLDGRRVLAILKGDNDLKRIPVVILTTSADERDIEECYQLGANTYIQKPVDLDGLFAAVQRLKDYWFEIALLPRES